jgi:hypothetical protein
MPPAAEHPSHSPRKDPWTEGELIDKILEWEHQFGMAPARTDWDPSRARRELPTREAAARAAGYFAGDWPNASTVMRMFGSWKTAILAAELAKRPTLRPPPYSRKRVHRELRAFVTANGRPPRRSDLDDPANRDGLPTYTTVRRLCGSLRQALTDAR